MSDETTPATDAKASAQDAPDANVIATDAPAATIARIVKHPSWATLDVRDSNDQPIGDEGALVDVNAEPYITLIERELVLLAPEPAPAKTGK